MDNHCYDEAGWPYCSTRDKTPQGGTPATDSRLAGWYLATFVLTGLVVGLIVLMDMLDLAGVTVTPVFRFAVYTIVLGVPVLLLGSLVHFLIRAWPR